LECRQTTLSLQINRTIAPHSTQPILTEMTDLAIVNRLLEVMEKDIVPLTAKGVREGNKLFGAAILSKKPGNELILAETNNETACPLFHGEVHCIYKFFQDPNHVDPKQTLFFATHEPCSLCLSAITWSGFDNFYYLFTYEDSKQAFSIPYDIDILKSVYQVADPGSLVSEDRDYYNRVNKFFSSYSIKKIVDDLPDGVEKKGLMERIDALKGVYDDLSAVYQQDKGGSKNIAFQ
jgi:tRNA(Arg) A34 adenosine deaminase TadA